MHCILQHKLIHFPLKERMLLYLLQSQSFLTVGIEDPVDQTHRFYWDFLASDVPFTDLLKDLILAVSVEGILACEQLVEYDAE